MNNNKLYIGGLSYSTTRDQLQDLFSEIGEVQSATIITDRDSGRSKGFGFVEMASPKEAAEAIAKFDGFMFDGRTITVNEARERNKRWGGGAGNRRY